MARSRCWRVKSEVEQGDTLVSEKNTYAQIRFIDNSEITLKPNTTFKVDAFATSRTSLPPTAPALRLVKGGLRSMTGLLGKRNRERFQLKTPSATIGIRGTTFMAQYVAAGDGARPRHAAAARPASCRHRWRDRGDAIRAAAQNFAAGQFGFVPSRAPPPVLVPKQPGLQVHAAAHFSSTQYDAPQAGGSQRTARG